MTVATLAPQQVPIRQWRLRRFRFRLFRLLCGVGIVFGVLALFQPVAYFSWNITDSLSGHVYLVVTVHKAERGQLVHFIPPSNPIYPAEMRFTKYRVGLPGDVITHKGREMFINGVSLGKAVEATRYGGRPLAMIPDGLIPQGYSFVWTPHPRSYDSRYAEIGLIADAQIIGRAYRLF